MTGLKGRLAALLGKGGRRRRFTGWVRVDPDNVVRGWAADPDDPDARAEVEVRIDGELAGRARADRLDPTLLGAQPGDGRYAFALVVPAKYRDGRPHAFAASVPETGSTLMSKAKTFAAAPGAPEPSLTLTAIGPLGVTGRLRGGQYLPGLQLEVWTGGRRLDGLETRWRQRGPRPEFRIDWPPETFPALDDQAVVAAPGMVEAGLTGAPLTVELGALRPGGDSCAEDEAAEANRGLAENLVVNGDLVEWPGGLIVQAGPGRAETAAGWFVQNRRGSAPVHAAAAPVAGGGARSLTLAVDSLGDYCRLEARLHSDIFKAGRELHLSFEAGVPAEAQQSFVVVDRIFLLRYARHDGVAVMPEPVATLARKVLLERGLKRFDFVFDLEPGAIVEHEELFLAFDFKRAFRATLQNVRLAPPTALPAETGLSLEDPAITAQARILKGLSSWLSTDVVEPGPYFTPEGQGAGSPGLRPAPAAQASVEVVVTVHDAADETLACLQSLASSSALPLTVRIVDDASAAETRERILDFIADKPSMRLVSHPENLGYTASANRGVRASDADWVVLLNSDTVVTPGWIEGLLEAAASDPRVALVGPMSNAASFQSAPELKDERGTWKVNALPHGWTPADMAAFIRERSEKAFPHVPLLNGFCLMIRREAFLALGGFNEAAFPQGYGEENDLCVRAAEAGWKLAVADHVYVYHSKSASFGAERRAALQKAAGRALAELHPNVDFTALGDRFREIPALARLRDQVRELYEAAG